MVRGRCDRENYVRLTETIRSRKPEFLMKTCLLADTCTRYKVANTRIVWVPNCYIDPKNALLKRPAPSGTWYFPTHVVFFHGNLDTNTKYSANRTVQQMVLLLGICIEYI